MYSPLLDTVTGVIPKSEIGRGAEMFNLLINISGSLGVAISDVLREESVAVLKSYFGK
ncbi:tetracycline resistance protein [Lactobacillus jensenii]|uniref:tetracycline resistance protein n=1 Tax=Lactobacillus jensenii TaxID=109790 RepID=UPI00336A02F7